jgi:hypothetical protein
MLIAETIQYIKLTQDLRFDILQGRSTLLDKGSPGFILNKENIHGLHDITKAQEKELLSIFLEAKGQNKTLALVQGFPCILNDNEFCEIKPLKNYPVPGNII